MDEARVVFHFSRFRIVVGAADGARGAVRPSCR
jgi:hypothetical protein